MYSQKNNKDNSLQFRRDEFKRSLNRKKVDYSDTINNLEELRSQVEHKDFDQELPVQSYFIDDDQYMTEHYKRFTEVEGKYINQLLQSPIQVVERLQSPLSVASSELLLDSSQQCRNENNLPVSGKVSCASVKSSASQKSFRSFEHASERKLWFSEELTAKLLSERIPPSEIKQPQKRSWLSKIIMLIISILITQIIIYLKSI